jgi:hypothetical protein
MAKEKAKGYEMTKKKEDDEKEFADPEIGVEGTKSEVDDEEAATAKKKQPESITIDGILPLMRKKGMKI